MSRTLAIVVVAAFLLGTATAPARGGSVTAALVLGSNHALDPDLDPLHYADDDALRTAALLGLVAGDVRVLVRPDAETLALHPEISWTAPRRAAVLAALGDLVKEAEAAAAAGDDVLLYVTYSGHGSYDAEGRGYLHLEDGRLTLRDLFHHLIEPTAGVARVILLIDACNAGFLVSARGEAKRRPAGPSTLLMEDYGHVGLVLASSSAGEVREWGRYLAGIFSHQVRSGLLGGADSDGDGRVGFGELAAFVAAANAAVTNPQYRLTPYIRPPLDDPELPVMDFRGAAGHTRVRVDLPGVRRVVVTDDNLVRIADLHLEEGFEPLLHLPSAGTWWFQAGDRELRVDAGEDREVRLSGREASPRADLSSKGVDSYLRRHLFEVPFGR
ncbi:MAG: hypothetical protein FJ098_07240, partial [Deltaproteobacteria bacterium]|nr:hypothetical protein [Deltaproteobacteria bacterium]